MVVGLTLKETINIGSDVNFILRPPFETTEAPYLTLKECECIGLTEASNMFGLPVVTLSHECEDDKLLFEIEFRSNYVVSFLQALWFVKDNCVDIGGFYYLDDTKTKIKRYLKRNTCADGSNTVISVTKEEWEKSIFYFKLFLNYALGLEEQKFIPAGDFEVQKSGKHAMQYNSLNRMHRALLFLAEARSTSFLPAKISYYIVLLESLFTDSGSEIVYKVSERVSRYIGKDFEDRKTIFEDVKFAYDIRSKYLHGANLDRAKLEGEQIKCSVRLDSLVRAVLVKALENAEPFISYTKEEFKKFLFTLTLS